MKGNGSLLSMAAMPAVLKVQLSAAAAVADKQALKVGKKGRIMLSEEMRVGDDLVLEPGHYEIQHRVRGSDHVLHLTHFKGMYQQFLPWSGPAFAHPGEAKCRLEPLRAKAAFTAIFTTLQEEERRVTKIKIKGENVAHV